VYQICSLVQWHHTTPHTWMPSNHPTRIVPVLIMEHRRITSQQASVLAKVKRIVARDQKLLGGCRRGCTTARCAYTWGGKCARVVAVRQHRARPMPGNREKTKLIEERGDMPENRP